MVNWKEIHSDFNEELQKQWENKDFTYEEAEKWIKFAGLKPTEANFAQWLRDTRKLGPKSILNKETLENEYVRKTTPPKKKLRVESNQESIQKELFEAIKSNDVEKAKKIIDKGKVNFDETYGEDEFAPLHLAVVYNNSEIIDKLLKNGADPDVKDSEGNTPLHFAAEQNNLELLKLLVKHEGNVNAVNEYNWSVLHSAASGIINEKEDWEVVELLLKEGAKTDVKADNGFTTRKVFLQKDYSYAEIYDKLIKKVISEKLLSHQQVQK
ncbi:MAG: tankyrase-2 [Mycoplasmataceae bacterium RV_VA103A]|nr:MAG: tankyrase-2 [Mycoplasmataceae bacterium RV_VA103A]